MENSIAVRRVVTRGAKTWKSRVSATIRHVHSPFEGMCLAVLLAWTPDKKIGGARTQLSVSLKTLFVRAACDPARHGRIDCEIFKTKFVIFSYQLPRISRGVGRVRSGGPTHRTTNGTGRATDAGDRKSVV